MEQELIHMIVLLLKEELTKLHLHWTQESEDLFEIYAGEYILNLPDVSDRDTLAKEMAGAIRDRQIERLSRTDSLSSLNLGEILKEDIPVQDNPRSTEDILDELENLEGLSRVKHRIRNIAQAIEMQKFREKRGSVEPLALHLILKGASPEKKTLTAHLLGELFFSMGYLSGAGFTEFTPADSGTSGDSARAVGEALSRAWGGILLIDADTMLQGDTVSLSGELEKQASAGSGKLTMLLCGNGAALDKLLGISPALKECFSFTLDFYPH
jgi:hypothetical protein